MIFISSYKPKCLKQQQIKFTFPATEKVKVVEANGAKLTV